jgi:hypothetical protein
MLGRIESLKQERALNETTESVLIGLHDVHYLILASNALPRFFFMTNGP